MNEVYKYCKFCNETKKINDFCKSGMFVKNICKECWNKKTRERYKNSKLVEEKDKEIERLNHIINKLEKRLINDKKFFENVYKKSHLSKEEFRKQCPYTIGSYDYSIEILDKLQTLKGDGSNEL